MHPKIKSPRTRPPRGAIAPTLRLDHYRRARRPVNFIRINPLCFHHRYDENNRLFFADNAAFNSEENKADREANESDREARGRDGGNLRTLVRDLRDFNHGGVHLDGAAADRLARNLAGAIQRRNETKRGAHAKSVTSSHAFTRFHTNQSHITKRGAPSSSTQTLLALLKRDA